MSRAWCSHCEAKDAELAYLRSELALVDDMVLVKRLRDGFQMRGFTEARMLAHLLRCRHHAATRLQLADLLSHEETEPSTVVVYLTRLRTALGPEALQNVWGEGWQLTEAGLARTKSVLEPDAPDPIQYPGFHGPATQGLDSPPTRKE